MPRPVSQNRRPTATTAHPALRELVAVPRLRLQLVHAPAEALDRRIRWVHSTELPDPSRYLRGSELVCTVGTVLLDPDACRRFVDALVTVDAAGVCFGVGDVHQQTPEALAAACRSRGLPLIEVPHGVRFLALSEYLAEYRIAAESEISARGERLVAQLLADVRRSVMPQELVASAARQLGGELVITVDATTLSAAAPPAPEGRLGRTRRVDAAVGDSVAAWWTGRTEPPSVDLLTQVARVVDVACYEQLAEQRRQRERVGQLFGLVADNLADVSALLPHLEAGGLAGEVTVSAWPARTGHVLATALPAAVIAEAPDTTFAVTAGSAAIVEAARTLALACGHGSTVSPGGLARSIAEARACLELARRHGRLVGPLELTSLDGLLEQQPPGRLDPFVDQLVAPLRHYDVRHRGSLLETLRTFLRTGGSLQQTARAHYLHVNTVRHRLGQVRRLTGRDPFDFDDRTALAIALWAHERSVRRGWPR